MKIPTYLFHKTEGMRLFDADTEDMKSLHEAGWGDTPVEPEPEAPRPISINNLQAGDIVIIEGMNDGKPFVLVEAGTAMPDGRTAAKKSAKQVPVNTDEKK